MSKYIEKPLFCASIYYYDSKYDAELVQGVLDILERYGFFPPDKLCAGKYTRDKYMDYKPSMRQVFTSAYREKDILSVEMAKKYDPDATDFWKLLWAFTFHKFKRLPVVPKYEPWNVLTLFMTYGLLAQEHRYTAFMSCIKELIGLINPFYAELDDTSNSITLMRAAHEPCFKPEYVQQLYWGNCFGERHCLRYGFDKLMQMPAYNVQQIGNGVFFTLTDCASDFSSGKCRRMRRKIKRYLGGWLFRRFHANH